MITFSDSIEFAAQILPVEFAAHRAFSPECDEDLAPAVSALLGDPASVHVGTAAVPAWTHLFLASHAARSQCDQLIELSRTGRHLPDHTACLAQTGSCFHGFKGRPWSAAPGNIHLAVHFSPGRVVERFEVAFTILAALSVAEAIDGLPGLTRKPGIRWVNDIVMGEAKIGGVLAYTQTQGQTVTSAVLGIGLNVDVTPRVEPTPFVPSVACLREFFLGGTGSSLRVLVGRLLAALTRNYHQLLQGGYQPLLERYRQRSTVTGKLCTVCTEESDHEPSVIAVGRLAAIGDGLELYIDGCRRPITQGRLLVGPPPSRHRQGVTGHA
jgi:biotin-(acetyl-CoA carboxylase) ligase